MSKSEHQLRPEWPQGRGDPTMTTITVHTTDRSAQRHQLLPGINVAHLLDIAADATWVGFKDVAGADHYYRAAHVVRITATNQDSQPVEEAP